MTPAHAELIARLEQQHLVLCRNCCEHFVQDPAKFHGVCKCNFSENAHELAAVLREAIAALTTPAPDLRALNGKELRKGTGDVLKDLDHAEHLTDTSEPGFGAVVCSGLELDFVNRAIRVARGEIKQLRQRLHGGSDV